MEQTLELKCDRAIAQTLNAQERTAYLRAILSAMKQGCTQQPVPQPSTALFRAEADKAMRERFTAVLACAEQPNGRTASAVLIGSFAVLLALSYALLPQPAFEPPAEPDSSSTVYFDDENAYLKQSADGRYWLCIDGHKPYELTEGDVQFYLEHSVFQIYPRDRAIKGSCRRIAAAQRVKAKCGTKIEAAEMWGLSCFCADKKKKPLKMSGLMVDINGFEPLTFRTSSGCSSS